MIALIALFALAVIIGFVVGICALTIALIKVLFRATRRSITRKRSSAASEEWGACDNSHEATDREFLRLVATEWPYDHPQD